MKSKNKRVRVTTDTITIVPVSPKTITSVVSVMTTDQKKMLKALGVFLL